MPPVTVSAAAARKIFILGAGASAADGAPVQAGLFRRYAEIVTRTRMHVHPERDGELRTFFSNFWGADIDSTNLAAERFPTFEEALGLLHLADVRGEFFKEFGGLPHEGTRARQIEQHLVETIAEVLDDALRGTPRVHRDFVQALARLNWLATTSFVSLNYDILIDNALTAGGCDVDYGARFRMVPSAIPRAVRLLKPHGSLNWLYCPTCNEVDLYPGEKIVAEILHGPHLLPCAVCDQQRRPILVPPTFFKTMSNYYLQQIWKSTEETFFAAEHLIFCGYSFPDADLHFKYLLKRAEMNRRDIRPIDVFVINEHPGKTGGARDAERERFLRFFRNKANVRWCNLSVGDLATDPTRYADTRCWLP